MFGKVITILILTIALCLGGCATPTTRYPQATTTDIDGAVVRYREHAAMENRAYKVGYSIMCGANGCQKKSVNDVWAVNSSYFKAQQGGEIAIKAWNLSTLQKIIALPPTSPLYKAGAREGDEILLEDKQAGKITVRGQDGKERAIPWPEPKLSCAVPIRITNGESPNAYADKGTIYINEGMMRFTNDEELAQVISHELAHVLMAHSDAKDWNSFLGTITGVTLDVFAAALGVNTQGAWTRVGAEAGSGYASQDWEREADYVGLYLMAKGGYDITKAPDFWKRMAKLYPQSAEPSLVSTHPSSAERYSSMGMAVAEISKKISLGQPLEPEKKK